MAKKVRVSDDNRATWSTLPGSEAEISTEAGDINDTVFGQSFRSNQTGLAGWTLSTNGLYKGFAGYVAKIMKAGTPTAMTGEAMSLVAGKTYQVTNVAKRSFSRTAALSVLDNAVAVSAANILNIDYLYGRVTFVPGYTVTGPVTVTGTHFPLAQIAKGRAFTLTQQAAAIDITDFETAQANSGLRVFQAGLKTVSLDIRGVFGAANAYRDLVLGRAEAIIEINPDGNSKSVARGFFKPMTEGQRGSVGELEEEDISWRLSVPDNDLMAYPFGWLHASDTTLNVALQKCLTAWQADMVLDWQYLYDGTNGVVGDGVITDLTLAGGLDVMNAFTVRVQGSGALAAVP
jgi:predicted secreted protein